MRFMVYNLDAGLCLFSGNNLHVRAALTLTFSLEILGRDHNDVNIYSVCDIVCS